MFKERKSLNLSEISKEIGLFWKKNNTFYKSVNNRPDSKRFVFFEGPPSANGKPGIHHIMARLIKDIFCRYKTLSGYRVERRAGWDTHGLPVELSVEAKLGITKDDIGKKVSVSQYNAECKKTVMQYTEDWNKLTDLMGYWVDTKNPYITYKSKYIESVWYLLKKLNDKGLIYKGYTIQPYSPAAGTGLSSHELNQPGCYKDVKDLSANVMFRLINGKELSGLDLDVFLVAWTTTPWTLFANSALAVGNNIEYLILKTFNPSSLKPCVIVCAKNRVNELFNATVCKKIKDLTTNIKKPYELIGRCLGKDLVGKSYEQLFKYVKPLEGMSRAFKIINADFVNTEGGTGIVHIAPTFGADDFAVAKKEGIPSILVKDKYNKPSPIVDHNGCFVDGLGPFSGRPVKADFLEDNKQSVDIDIVVILKNMGRCFSSEKYEHSYPHCWRTDKPILYYPLDSWFIKSTKYKDLMIKKNQEINWKPKSTGEGRFQNWLENLNDWNLSRSRFWGIPLPIWKSSKSNETLCVGSVEELKNLCEQSVKDGNMSENPLTDFEINNMGNENYDQIDLHKNIVDDIVLSDSNGQPMYREKDVIDVWFDSGAMPFAQWHYPFENKELIDSGLGYPADFIAEGVDQTRGWFYTLHAISVMCFESLAYKNVISNGLVLDKYGQKMSKRLGNSVDPFKSIEAHGADTLRWYMVSNSQPWDNLKFDEGGVNEVQNKFFGTLHNTYSFFALYSNIDKFTNSEKPVAFDKRPQLDRWILSELTLLTDSVKKNYENYEPTLACREIQNFTIEKLSNWYVRLCRRRFWRGEYDANKISAYQTLYECLKTIAIISSPIAPFFMEQLFLDLCSVRPDLEEKSVHLSEFPVANKKFVDRDLVDSMKITKEVCSLALSLRKKQKIRVRQPLKSLTACINNLKKSKPLVEIIMSELNVKSVILAQNTNDVVEKKLSVNFPVLGKKHGKRVKRIVEIVNSFNKDDINLFEKQNKISVDVDGCKVLLEKDDLIVNINDIPGQLTAAKDGVLVSLNTKISKELLEEGFAREFINKVQNIRKDSGFSVTDKVNVVISGNTDALNIIKKHENYISPEILSQSIVNGDVEAKNSSLFDFNNYKMYIALSVNNS